MCYLSRLKANRQVLADYDVVVKGRGQGINGNDSYLSYRHV